MQSLKHSKKAEKNEYTKNLLYYKCVFHFFRIVLGYPVKWACRFKYTPYKVKSKHFLLVANHTTNCDPIYEAVAVNRHMKYVANEAVLQYGIWGRIVNVLQKPIPKRKGASGEEVINKIEQYLRNGVSVALHAEGNRSYTGETGFISPRTGQMIKEAGSGGLVTFRFRGGYFKSPRWAKHSRRGTFYGNIVNEYSREQLDKMTADEINEIIRRDLYINAYEEQCRDMNKYKGKALAESLEIALYICPCCKGISTMFSHGDLLTCRECKTVLKMNEYGFFEKVQGEMHFDNVKDWDDWQRKYVSSNMAQWLKHTVESGSPISVDQGMQLDETFHDNSINNISQNCRVSIYCDRIRVEYTEAGRVENIVSGKDATRIIDFMMSDISRLAINGKTTVVFTCRDEFYKITKKDVFSNLKYFAFFRYLSGREYL